MKHFVRVLFLCSLFLFNCCNGGEVILRNNSTVIEYLPAPGQYINDTRGAGFNGEISMVDAVEYANNRINDGYWVSLGGFGGYIVFSFKNGIQNDGGYNVRISSNATSIHSEPGIVWVMVDDNENGKPDETWYELKGSGHGNGTSRTGYSVTYYKPGNSSLPVMWNDSDGNSGQIDYLGGYHDQDYYYPNWVETPSYTLSGSLLASRTSEQTENNWLNAPYDWGYADNFSDIDRLNSQVGICYNHFRISDAIDVDGQPVNLEQIHFVKIQTAVNDKSGWLGEISTEISGITDYNSIK